MLFMVSQFVLNSNPLPLINVFIDKLYFYHPFTHNLKISNNFFHINILIISFINSNPILKLVYNIFYYDPILVYSIQL